MNETQVTNHEGFDYVEDFVEHAGYLRLDQLEHHGVLGMKWGVRRYQNKDGSLTSKGKAHQAKSDARDKKRQEKVSNAAKKFNEAGKAHDKKTAEKVKTKQAQKEWKKGGTQARMDKLMKSAGNDTATKMSKIIQDAWKNDYGTPKGTAKIGQAEALLNKRARELGLAKSPDGKETTLYVVRSSRPDGSANLTAVTMSTKKAEEIQKRVDATLDEYELKHSLEHEEKVIKSPLEMVLEKIDFGDEEVEKAEIKMGSTSAEHSAESFLAQYGIAL